MFTHIQNMLIVDDNIRISTTTKNTLIFTKIPPQRFHSIATFMSIQTQHTNVMGHFEDNFKEIISLHITLMYQVWLLCACALYLTTL